MSEWLAPIAPQGQGRGRRREGANGNVGKEAAVELGKRHTIVTLGRSSGDVNADLMNPDVISLYVVQDSVIGFQEVIGLPS